MDAQQREELGARKERVRDRRALMHGQRGTQLALDLGQHER